MSINLKRDKLLTLGQPCRDAEVSIANPDEPLSDDCIAAMASLLLAAVDEDITTE